MAAQDVAAQDVAAQATRWGRVAYRHAVELAIQGFQGTEVVRERRWSGIEHRRPVGIFRMGFPGTGEVQYFLTSCADVGAG